MKSVKYVVKVLFLLFVILGFVVLFRGWCLSDDVIEDKPLVVRSTQFDIKTAVDAYAETLTFKTISSEDNAEYDQQFDLLFAFLKERYPEVFSKLSLDRVGKHGILLTWFGSNRALKPVLFMAHQDVVPIDPDTESNWHQPPFSGAIAEGYVWGRGALDCKATLTALLFASSTLIKEDFVPKRTIYFYFGDDEENGGKTAALASTFFNNKGIHFKTVFDEAGMIAEGLFPDVQSPVALIAVAEKGWLNLELSVKNEGGHSSIPPSHTAIGDLSQAINQLQQKPFQSQIRGVTKHLLEQLALKQPFYKRLLIANSWLFEPFIISQLNKTPLMAALLHTTQAPTIFNAGLKSNVLPIQARAVINFRIDPYDSVSSVLGHVKQTITNPVVTVKTLMGWEPSPISSASSASYKLLASAIAAIYGKHVLVAPFVLTGGTDARHFASIADNVYRFFPIVVNKEDLIRFHGTDERYAIAEYQKMIRFYYTLLANQ